jgi:hypothetical protein
MICGSGPENVVMILLEKISHIASLAMPFLAAFYQLLLVQDVWGRPWKVAGTIGCAVFLLFVGWAKLSAN